MPPCRERAGASCLAILWLRATSCSPKRLPGKGTREARWRWRTILRLDNLASQTSRDYRCRLKSLCSVILLRSSTLPCRPEFFGPFRIGAIELCRKLLCHSLGSMVAHSLGYFGG